MSQIIPSASFLSNPMIGFTNTTTWAVIAENGQMSGVWSIHTMPVVDCPVIDTAAADPDKVHEIVRKHVSPAGCSDITGLVRELSKVGGRLL